MSVTHTDLSTRLSLGSGDANAILLLSPSFSDHENGACTDLLTVAEPARENVLSITFTQSPTDRLQVWQRQVGDNLPAEANIISVGDESRSSGATASSAQQSASVTVTTISNPGNLTQLGITLTAQLDQWSSNENQTVVCFHSLSALLQYADLKPLFKFLHTIIARFRKEDAVAHFHLASDTHDKRTINTLKQLFDTIIEIDHNGEQHIKQK